MKGKSLTEPVVFQTLKLSMRLQIKGSPSEQQDPAAALHPLTKWANFVSGIFTTDDPEIIQVLDTRDDVWRAGDPVAHLKAKYGDQYAELAAEFAAAQEPASVEEAE